MKTDPISILLIEDNRADARFIEIMLSPEKERYEIVSAETLREGFEKLDENGFDIILLDLGLPDSQGMDTLTRTHSRAHTVPIVVFTGLIDEDAGYSAIQNGAQDYLIKGQIDNRILIRAIHYAIQRKKIVNALRESEDFTKNILESVDEGFIVVDRGYKITSANRAYCKMVGRTPDKVIGQYCYMLSHNRTRPCHEKGIECPVKQSFETGRSHETMHTYCGKDGKDIYVDTKSYPVKDDSGAVVSVIETINDITEKINSEKEIKKRIKELEDFYKMAVGRELKMKELKEKISMLEGQLSECRGQTP